MSQADTRKPSNDDEPENIDAFRNRLARHISQLVSQEQGIAWRNCRERVCRRHRQCVAPRIHCSNAKPDTRTPEERAAGLAQLQAEIYKALAACGAEEYPRHPEVAATGSARSAARRQAPRPSKDERPDLDKQRRSILRGSRGKGRARTSG